MVMGGAHDTPLSSQERRRWWGVASAKTTSAGVRGFGGEAIVLLFVLVEEEG
jgi:hypothetical protein